MTTQYIGARYVPKFADPSEWANNMSYEPLTIVTYNGNSFTSKKTVPAGLTDPAHNSEYWASTGIYNSQIESYREEVAALAEQYDDVLDTANSASDAAASASTTAQAANTTAQAANTTAQAANTTAQAANTKATDISSLYWDMVEGKTIGIFGASNAQPVSGRWGMEFTSLVGDHATVDVLGVGGTTLSAIVTNVETRINDYDIVIIDGTSNDASQGVELGGPGYSNNNLTYWEQFDRLRSLIARYPTKTFYMVGIAPQARTRAYSFRYPISAYRQYFEYGAYYCGAYYIDGIRAYGNLNSINASSVAADGSHYGTPYSTYKAKYVLRAILNNAHSDGQQFYFENLADTTVDGASYPRASRLLTAGDDISLINPRITYRADTMLFAISYQIGSGVTIPATHALATLDVGLRNMVFTVGRNMCMLGIKSASPYNSYEIAYAPSAGFFYCNGAITGPATINTMFELPTRLANSFYV